MLDPNNQAIVYIGGEVIDRSTNHCQGGFTQISPGGADDLPGPIPPDEQDTGLYANLYGAVTAIGAAKDALPGSTPPNNYAQTIYAGTDTGLLWKTSDAGANWTKLTPQDELPTRWVNGIAVDPDDANHAYVVFSGYREGDNAANIWETKNGGTFWANISGNLPNAPLDAVVLDKADDVVIVSGDLGVFFLRKPQENPKSTTWTRLGTNLPNTSVQDIKIQASTNTLYAMTFGRGVQTIPLPPAYPFGGFTSPTANPPALNSAVAFSMVTVKFSLGANYGQDILANGYPQSIADLVHDPRPDRRNDSADDRRARVRGGPVQVPLEDPEAVEGHVPAVRPEARRRDDARRELQVHVVAETPKGARRGRPSRSSRPPDEWAPHGPLPPRSAALALLEAERRPDVVVTGRHVDRRRGAAGGVRLRAARAVERAADAHREGGAGRLDGAFDAPSPYSQ